MRPHVSTARFLRRLCNWRKRRSVQGPAEAGHSADGREPESESIALFVTELEPRIVLNAAPTDIDLTELFLQEDEAPGSLIGVLSAVDEDSPSEALSFHLIDNGQDRFEIVNGNELRVAQGAEFDFETQASIDVTVQVVDEQQLAYEESFVLEVGDATEAVVVDASAWTADGLTVQARDGLLMVEHTGTQISVIPQHALSSVARLEIVGRDGAFDDTLTVDLTNGSLGEILFDGGSGGNDALVITGGTAEQITHSFENASDGSVNVDETSIHYQGLEPIIQTITVSDVVLEFSAADETITVSDSGTPGQTTVDSTAAESVTFVNPTSSLTILAGAGDDTIDVVGFGQNPAFGAALTVDGSAGIDVVNFTALLAITGGDDLSISAETVNINQNISVEADGTVQLLGTASSPADGDVVLNAAITAETGSVFLRADRSVEFTSAGRLVTAGGDVTIEADRDGLAGGEWLLPVGAAVESGHARILAAADSMQIDGTLDSGLEHVVLVDSDGSGIGLGDAAVVGGLNVTRDELSRITARVLRVETSGSIQVNRVTLDAAPGISDGFELVAQDSVSFHSAASSFAALTVAAHDGVEFLADVTTSTGALSVDGDTDAGDETGTVSVATGVVLRGLNNAIRLTADDLVLNGQLFADGSSALLIDSDASGMGIGQATVVSGFNLSNAELQRITADRLILKTEGTAIVDGVDAIASAHLASGISILTDNDVVFTANPSTLTALDVQAADQILVEQNLTTTAGSLQLHSDANNLVDSSDDIVFSDGVTIQSADTIVLQPANALGVAARGAMTALGELTLRARSGITLNHSLTSDGVTIVNADTDADGDGDLVLTANTVLATQDHLLDITANDIYLEAPAVVTFQDGVYPTSGYDGTRDVTIRSQFRETNFGADQTLIVDGVVESATTLIQWDLSSIPSGVDVTAVNLTLEVTNGTSDAYQVYQLIRPWSEDEATWTQASTGNAWGLAGALGISDIDRKMLGEISGTDLGTQTFQFNTHGVDAVRSWLADPTSNFGLAILNPTHSDDIRFDSREVGQAVERPSLRIEYQPQVTGTEPPTILDSGSARTTIRDSDGTGVGLGDAVILDGLNLSGSQVENIRASDLFVETAGGITVQNLLESETNSIAGDFRLTANDLVRFDVASSVFNALTVESSTGVLVDVPVSTDAGPMTIVADVTLAGGTGDLVVSSTGSLATNDGTLEVVANDVQLAGLINSGNGTAVFVDSDGSGIGLGTSNLAAGLNLDNDELARISAEHLQMTTTGDIRVGGVTLTHINGTVEIASGHQITFEDSLSEFNAVVIAANDGVDVQVTLHSHAGGLTIDADADALDNDGTLSVSGSINSSAGPLSVTADDVILNGTLASGGFPTVLIDSDGTGIGLGAAAVVGGLNLDNSELERMTAADATLRTNGSTHVDGVGSAATLNIAGNLILETGGGVRFLNAASVLG